MRTFFLTIGILSSLLTFSQENAKKAVSFVYKKSPKIEIKNNNVIADSLFFRIYFPEIKIHNKNVHNKSSKKHFIKLEELNKKEKQELASIIYHNSEMIYGNYYPEKRQTILVVKRNDDEAKAAIENQLNEKYQKFTYTITFNFFNKKINYNYPKVNYTYNFDEKGLKLIKSEVANQFTFQQKTPQGTALNIASSDNSLPSTVTPEFFINNNFGINKIETIAYTIELIEVK